jgi:hypothetical protein
MSGESRGPIVIGGLSRTGKTQARLVLEAHPDLSLTRRTKMWTRFYERFGDLAEDHNLERCLSVMLADPAVGQLEPDPERIRRELHAGAPSYARLFGLFHRHHAQRRGKRRWGDQLGHAERFAEPILSAFPDARIVHMVRDPRTVAAVDGALRRGRLGRETALWLESARLALRNVARCPDRYTVVRYEDLARDPHETIGQVCAFLGEECLPEMTRAASSLRFDDAASTEAPRSERASRSARAFIDEYAGPELDALGYEHGLPRRSRLERVGFLVTDWPLNRLGMAAWRTLDRAPVRREAAS